MTNKLFVAGLSYDITDAKLEAHFAQVGTVVSAKAIMDKFTNQGKGFGFVEMASEEEAKRAINKLNGTQLDERTIVVKEAKPQENRGFQPRNDHRN
ncbi:MAG: RNA-binding protein [Patescibacteria group bacterium]|mgnify:CR=1 FL=1